MEEFAIYPSLENKVVLITGGASGIGENIVEHFITQKSKVAFLDIEEKLGSDLVTKLEKKYNLKATFIKCNLKKIDELKKSIKLIREKLGPISILINNAANDERHKIEDVTEEFWNDRMNVNLRHYFFTVQSVREAMIKNNGVVIVNIGSASWMIGQGGMAAYTAAKSGVVGLTRSFARDLGEYNIRVNYVVPGWTITQRQLEKWLTPESETEMMKKQCIKKRLMPSDIAKAVLFFSSNQSSGWTNQSYVVDNGWL